MKNTSFIRWCNTATEKIKYRPDRQAVAEELRAHLEDHYDSLIANGLSPKEASDQALAAMGSPDELAPVLAEIHKPLWGYLYSAASVLLAMCLIAFCCVCLYQGVRFLTDGIYAKPDYSNAAFNPFDSDSDGSNIFCEKPGAFCFDYGYLIHVTKVSCWDDPQNSLYFQVDVTSILPLCDRPDFCYYFCVRDNWGNVYPCKTVAPPITDPEQLIDTRWIQGRIWQTSPLSWTYDAVLPSFDTEGIEWIELYYQRDGRDFAVRIDLPRGEIP